MMRSFFIFNLTFFFNFVRIRLSFLKVFFYFFFGGWTMGAKVKIVILAIMIAVVVGLLLFDWGHSKNSRQVISNDMNKELSQDYTHTLQDKSVSEGQKDARQPNQEPKSEQPDIVKPEQENPRENSPQEQQKALEEHVLISVNDMYRFAGRVNYIVIIDGLKEETFITFDNTSVQLRMDGMGITTIMLSNKADIHSVFNNNASGIILVPNQEDVVIWQNWLNKLKQQYKEFLAEQEARKKGSRILPPTD